MKKIYSIMLAALAVCAVSCQEGPLESQTPEAGTGKTMTFTATMDQPADPASKAVLNGLKTNWENGDGITVFDANGHHAIFTTTLEAPAATATFTCENIPANFDAPYTAVYGTMDQSKVKLEDGKVVGVEIPAGQVLRAASYNRYAAPAIAYAAEGTHLAFQNVATLLKFTAANDGINKVTIWMTAENGDALPITGLGSLDYNNGNPVLTLDEVTKDAAKTYVDLTGTFVKGETYYVVVNPVAYHSLSAKVNGIPFKTSNHPKTLVRNTQVPLGDFTLPEFRFYLAGNEAAGMKWEATVPFTEEDNYYVVRGHEFGAGSEFKVIDTKYGSWLGGTFALNSWTAFGGEANFIFGKNQGQHDIYLKKDLSGIYVTPTAAAVVPTGETCYKIHVLGTQYNDLWAWSTTNGNWFGAWPGKYRFDTVNVDGLGECNQWVVYLDNKFNENACQLILSYWVEASQQRPQIQTSANFTLAKNLYFKVTGENNDVVEQVTLN